MANLQIKCPNCSGSIVFDAKKNKMVCQFCDSSFDVGDTRLTENQEMVHKGATLDSNVTDGEHPDEYWKKIMSKTLGYQCPSCGGTIIGTENSSAIFCPYCGNPSIIESNLEGAFRPDYIIPFSTTREDAIKAYKKFCGKGLFMPKSFNPANSVDKVTGIYVPYHLYSCTAGGNATYDCEKIKTWEDSEYSYRKVDTYLVKRAGYESFENVPADASKSIDDDFMESIEPFNYKKMVPFDMKYLSGFISDKYDVVQQNVMGILSKRIENTFFGDLRSTVYFYDHVNTRTESCSLSSGSFSYALLPVWLLRAKYKKKYYYFAMNGETGKKAGRMPISPLKVSIFTLIIILISGVAGYYIGGESIYWALGFGFVAGLIAGLVSGSLYKNVRRKNNADQYVSVPLVLTHSNDIFISTQTSKVRKNNDNKQ